VTLLFVFELVLPAEDEVIVVLDEEKLFGEN